MEEVEVAAVAVVGMVAEVVATEEWLASER